MIKNCC